jgi:hypothetical protein
MKRAAATSIGIALALSVSIFSACNRTVQAGSDDSDTYQPRGGSATAADSRHPGSGQAGVKETTGEISRVDAARHIITIRLNNGMEQTFLTDETTDIGAPAAGNGARARSADSLRSLSRQTGKEVTVKWRESGDDKVANSVSLTSGPDAAAPLAPTPPPRKR